MLIGMLAHLKLVGLAKKKDRMAGDFTLNERRLVEVLRDLERARLCENPQKPLLTLKD